MRQSLIGFFVILAMLTAPFVLAGTASAQTRIIEDEDDYYYSSRVDGPRVYGYSRYYNAPVVDPPLVETYPQRPSGPNGCGTYYFWNGERCVDARNR